MPAHYDEIGRSYTHTRRPDPRIFVAIDAALGDARTVVNVGAGAGSYEPGPPREVVAVEPSAAMIAQRAPGSAPVIQGTAEKLPFADDEFDAALAVLTIHHWADVEAGLAELRRVARRVVILTFDPAVTKRYWLVAEYLPQIGELDDSRAIDPRRVAELLGGATITPVPIPHDCADGFLCAWWRRPEAYLDPVVRAGISPFGVLDDVDLGLERLRADLASGAWQERHADPLALDELECGYRLVVSGAR